MDIAQDQVAHSNGFRKSSADYSATGARQTHTRRSGFGGLFANREVAAVRMMEYESAHACFGVHHHSFGEVDANILGTKQHPDPGLIFQIRAGGIPETIALASIAGSKSLR